MQPSDHALQPSDLALQPEDLALQPDDLALQPDDLAMQPDLPLQSDLPVQPDRPLNPVVSSQSGVFDPEEHQVDCRKMNQMKVSSSEKKLENSQVEKCFLMLMAVT